MWHKVIFLLFSKYENKRIDAIVSQWFSGNELSFAMGLKTFIFRLCFMMRFYVFSAL